jgi:tetratricopeptide (TPR) repeat protein
MPDGATPSPTSSRHIRVFVSSTFRDMQAERDSLVKYVFPELKRRCRERQVELVEVDLRWGVTEEQAERGEILPVCLAEIDQCRPYFIGLLGERYGWVPERIDRALLESQPWLAEHTDHSITALEILHGVLNNPAMANHAFFYFRDPAFRDRAAPEARTDLEAEGPTAHEKLVALKQRIRASGLPVREHYPDPETVGQFILEDLWQVIAERFPPRPAIDPLDQEAADHEAFGESRLRVYLGRAEAYERVDAHVASEEPPLVLLGESGSGKSALLANWARRWRQRHPEDFLLLHFIGSTAESTDYTRILRRILGELKRRFDLPGEVPTEASAVCREFPNWLSMAGARGRVILVLDALNQLEDRDQAPELAWFPEYVPPTVRVLLSSLPGPSLDVLKRRGYPTFQVEPLSSGEQRKLIDDYLWQYRKRLSGPRIARLLQSPPTTNPLYLRVLLDELRVFGVHEQLNARLDAYLEAQSPAELYRKVLERLEADYEKERPGLVGEALALLWAARRGLTESELLDLLVVPRALWSPMYLAAQDSLVVRSGLLGFFHDYLRQAVQERYLVTEQQKTKAHQRLAAYFEHPGVTDRKVDELPWHLYQAGETERLERALSDLAFSQAIWDKNPFDLYTYWAFLERGGDFQKQRTYQKVVQNPGNHQNHLFWVSELCYRTGVLEASLTIRKAWAALAQKAGDLDSLRAALSSQAVILQVWGELNGALTLLKEAERLARTLGSTDGLLVALGNQAVILQDCGDLDGALALIKEQVRLARELGDKDGLQISLGNQGVIHWVRGDLDEAMRLHEEQAQICRETGNKDGLSRSLGNQANIHYARGDLDEAMRLHEEEERICRQLGHRGELWGSLNNQALIHYDRGEYDRAMRLFKEQEQICRELGNKNGLQGALGNQALIHYDRGEFDRAMRLCKEQEQICRELGNKNGLQTSLANQANIHSARGELDDAMNLHKEQGQICRELDNKHSLAASFGNQAGIYHIRGELDQAMTLYKEQEKICRELREPEGLAICLANQAELLAEKLDRAADALPLAEEAEALVKRHNLTRLAAQIQPIIDAVRGKAR